jgi:hypothetical protein
MEFAVLIRISQLCIGLILAACSNTQFEGQAPNRDSKNPKDSGLDAGGSDDGDSLGKPGNDANSDHGSAPGNGDRRDDDSYDGDDTDSKSGNPDLTDEEIKIRQTECWFAVSGAYLAAGQYNSTFPSTQSGKSVGHNESFDDAGGVFLAASPEPYVVGQGGKEIDLAVAQTFDSIAVAPGMRAEIKDANGSILYSGDGPAFFFSTEYGSHDLISQASAYMKTNVATYPRWMRTILKSKSYMPERRPLHGARSVQVSKVAGKRCDF